MIKQPPPGIPPQEPPPPQVNRAQGCFHVLLWLMPSFFSVASAWGIWAGGFGSEGLITTISWLILNLGFIGLAGWFNAVISPRVRVHNPDRKAGGILASMVMFLIIQIGLIPILVVSLGFAFCVVFAR